MSPSNPPDRPQITLTTGPLAAEGALLGDLAEHFDAAPEAWSRPLLLVLPSRTLRDHVQAQIVAHRGAALGIRCTTLFGLALEVTEDVGGRLLAGSDFFPLFARRLARQERALRQALEPLSDGYSTLLGPVRDLLDAGLDPALADGMIEALASDGKGQASTREIQRAQALVRIAAGTVEALGELATGRRSTLLAAAAERLRSEPGSLTTYGVWVYGFSDASGVALDFIEALLALGNGRLYLDQPPDPADRSQADAGVIFTRRFRERLEARARTVSPASGHELPREPQVEIFRALGSDGEVREVVRRIRGLLDDGARPERILVVARQLSPYARSLRQHFAALGVPFSTYGGIAAKDRLGRRAEAFADLLDQGVETPAERWLELVKQRFAERPMADVRTGLATLGLGRLREAAALAADSYRREHKLRLPVRLGYSDFKDEAGVSLGLRLRYRYLPADALASTLDAAQALADHFENWDQATTLGDHLKALESLARDHLGWAEDPFEQAILSAALAAWEPLPADFELSRTEFCEASSGRLRDFGARQLGGSGGGVQVLDVVGARGLTAEHLFVIGLNRGVFPRLVTEDPLLPDSLRGVLSRQGHGVLPDLPDKLSGFDEERFLFAQLMAASPRLTLSWQDTDDEQMPLAPSPLLERLRWVSDDPTWHLPELARPVIAQPAGVPRTPLENGIVVGIEASRSRFNKVLPLLLPAAHRAVAPVRAAILAEFDPDLSSSEGRATARELGPYFGFVSAAPSADPRSQQDLFVTTLEKLSGCPWQVFLRRLLGLQRVPDPLASLPGITPLLIGALTHDVLEAIVLRGLHDRPDDMAQARHRLPQAIPWPEPKELDDILFRASEALCRREGIAVLGFARLLAQAVLPHLEMARQLDWATDGGLHVLGAELRGQLPITDFRGAERAVHFRADRLDLAAKGMVLTDYKTGKRTVSSAKQDKARRRHLLDSVQQGERLQGVAYALAAGEPGDAGRYLFIGPEATDDPTLRDVRLAADDRELEQAFRGAAGAALAVWDSGCFFPRVVEPQRDEEPFRCDFCEVRDACVRGDSGARRRLRSWADERHDSFRKGAQLSDEELAVLTLWRLPMAAGK